MENRKTPIVLLKRLAEEVYNGDYKELIKNMESRKEQTPYHKQLFDRLDRDIKTLERLSTS